MSCRHHRMKISSEEDSLEEGSSTSGGSDQDREQSSSDLSYTSSEDLEAEQGPGSDLDNYEKSLYNNTGFAEGQRHHHNNNKRKCKNHHKKHPQSVMSSSEEDESGKENSLKGRPSRENTKSPPQVMAAYKKISSNKTVKGKSKGKSKSGETKEKQESKSRGSRHSQQNPIREDKIPELSDLLQDDSSELRQRALKTYKEQKGRAFKTIEKLREFALRNKGREEITDPKDMGVPLISHQKKAVAWMMKREASSPSGGILADDMGLGKTLTTIALILKDAQNGGAAHRSFSTLIVCPASVIGQWGTEISTKVQKGKLTFHQHHGSQRATEAKVLLQYHVVLTTYGILQSEHSLPKGGGPLFKVEWKRVVLDEAHIIRNHKSKTAAAVFNLQMKHRWALTGTPIHNKVEDYFSLMKFIKCEPFDDFTMWKSMLDNQSETGNARLHLLTKSILIRRTKEEIQKEGGLPGLKPKEFINIPLKLDAEEFQIYTKICEFSKALFARYVLEKKYKGSSAPFSGQKELNKLVTKLEHEKGVKTQHIFVLILRLRQVCCHPSLVEAFMMGKTSEDDEEATEENHLIGKMVKLAIGKPTSSLPVFRKNRISSKIKTLLTYVTNIIKNSNDKIVIVSQWVTFLNIIKSFLPVEAIILDGSTKVSERTRLVEVFNVTGSDPRVLLLSLGAGGVGLNLIGANHLMLADLHWNPQAEAQATDRVYRLGQKKPVKIYKFITQGTIEERVVNLQEEKKQMANSVLLGNKASKLSMRDLTNLIQ